MALRKEAALFAVVFWSILAYAFVGGAVALLIFVIWELSPFSHHEERYR